MKPLAAVVILAAALGCNPGPRNLMPLAEGHKWTYNVMLDFGSTVQSLEVSRRISVAGEHGWELTGPMGSSRLAWVGGTLVGERLAGTTFSPPVPLLAAEEMSWEGTATTAGQARKGRGRLTISQVDVELAGRTYESTLSKLEIGFDSGTLELLTWFVADLGIIRQEQRIDGVRNRKLDYLSGP